MQVENIGASTVASASREQLVYIIDTSKAVVPEALEILTVRSPTTQCPYFAGGQPCYATAVQPSKEEPPNAVHTPHCNDQKAVQMHSNSRLCLQQQDAVLNPKFSAWDVKAAAARLEEDIKTLADNPQSLLLEVSCMRCPQEGTFAGRRGVMQVCIWTSHPAVAVCDCRRP